MKLDVKNLAFGTVGETDSFDLEISDFVLAEDLLATSLKGKIKLTRLDDSILAEIKLEALVGAECDRCLEKLTLSLPIEFSCEISFGGVAENEDNLLMGRDFTVDLIAPIQEEIVMSIPIKKLCFQDCRGLCVQCGASLNKKDCNCSNLEK